MDLISGHLENIDKSQAEKAVQEGAGNSNCDFGDGDGKMNCYERVSEISLNGCSVRLTEEGPILATLPAKPWVYIFNAAHRILAAGQSSGHVHLNKLEG